MLSVASAGGAVGARVGRAGKRRRDGTFRRRPGAKLLFERAQIRELRIRYIIFNGRNQVLHQFTIQIARKLAQPSVLRAGVMATIALTGVLLGRPRAAGVVLAVAVLFLLVLDPWLVYAIGFQLSVAATAGMVALASPLAERLQRFLPRPVALAAGTTTAAQIGVTPLLLFHFHEVPGVTILANLAAFPAVSPALLLGIAASVLGLVWLPLGKLVSLLALVPMRYLRFVASLLARAPVAWITTGGGPSVLVVGAAVFVAVAWWLRSGRRLPRPALVCVVAVCFGV